MAARTLSVICLVGIVDAVMVRRVGPMEGLAVEKLSSFAESVTEAALNDAMTLGTARALEDVTQLGRVAKLTIADKLGVSPSQAFSSEDMVQKAIMAAGTLAGDFAASVSDAAGEGSSEDAAGEESSGDAELDEIADELAEVVDALPESVHDAVGAALEGAADAVEEASDEDLGDAVHGLVDEVAPIVEVVAPIAAGAVEGLTDASEDDETAEDSEEVDEMAKKVARGLHEVVDWGSPVVEEVLTGFRRALDKVDGEGDGEGADMSEEVEGEEDEQGAGMMPEGAAEDAEDDA